MKDGVTKWDVLVWAVALWLVALGVLVWWGLGQALVTAGGSVLLVSWAVSDDSPDG